MSDTEANYFMFAFTILLNTHRLSYSSSYYGDFYSIITDPSYLCMCAAVFYDKGSILSLLNCWAFLKNLR